ncbi:hypothetical protein Scep_014355 [Stephania cephalantha]|uniref:Uncharacterized protein n=1 Tax=Stephania cephalantha TaxID=152367 RepID=A0AAP0J134_9MAGN
MCVDPVMEAVVERVATRRARRLGNRLNHQGVAFYQVYGSCTLDSRWSGELSGRLRKTRMRAALALGSESGALLEGLLGGGGVADGDGGLGAADVHLGDEAGGAAAREIVGKLGGFPLRLADLAVAVISSVGSLMMRRARVSRSEKPRPRMTRRRRAEEVEEEPAARRESGWERRRGEDGGE